MLAVGPSRLGCSVPFSGSASQMRFCRAAGAGLALCPHPAVPFPRRCAQGGHRNDGSAAAQSHPPGELPEAERAAARPHRDRQPHGTRQGRYLCF